ncbi:hypothetical protein HB829_14120 [Listeria innocua]|uniref:hypothetical protein n=1 Tax=Listeria innocua TaxID=1642 RepID=UPI0016247233|nr:hypothetical protein [Listeria innocua]MBC1378065.1 hypothetical protein [Listeria innocua]MBC1388522.1 hypothetical protein [Listeria innocua]
MRLNCPNELGIYNKKVYLEFPAHMFKENGGYYTEKRGCLVDPCMVNEIEFLWEKGIVTTGCCCGHGKTFAYIDVASYSDCLVMYQLKYESHINVSGKTSFFAKSKHENTKMVTGK